VGIAPVLCSIPPSLQYSTTPFPSEHIYAS
jgi:hypothetical protein